MDKTELKARIDLRKQALSKLWDAYLVLIDGGVKTYMIDDRQLSALDLPELKREIEDLESQIDELNGLLNAHRPRRAFGVVPRDW